LFKTFRLALEPLSVEILTLVGVIQKTDVTKSSNGERATGNGQRATGNGQRATGNGEPGTGVWERVYSGNPPKNSTWRTKKKKGEQYTILQLSAR